MKNSFSKKESIEIIKRALTTKDTESDQSIDSLDLDDLKTLAEEFGVSHHELKKAVAEVIYTKEHKRDELYPEIISQRWVNGKLNEENIEEFFMSLKMEFGDSNHWSGKPAEVHKMGKTWEYRVKDATVILQELDSGYKLQVLKHQFFHGNNLEALFLAIPIAFILGLLPVAAAAEWLNILSAVFLGAISYIASFAIVKKFIQKMRTKTNLKLLQITNFAEEQLQKLIVDPSPSTAGTIQLENDKLDAPGKGIGSRNKLRE